MQINLVVKLALILVFGFSLNANAQRKSKKAKPKSGLYIQQEAEYYFIEGEKQYILEDYAKAVTNFRSSIQLVSTNDAAYFKLAQIYNQTNQLAAAKLSIKKALALNSKNPYYYLLAADIYTNTNNLKEATKYYELLISKVPGEEHTFFQLGAIYLYLQEYENALLTYQRAENHFGVNEQTSVQKQKIYLKLNEIDKAIAEGQKLIDAFPSNPKYVIMLAEILSANGKEPQAISLIENLLSDSDDIEDARLLLADLYRKTKQLDSFEAQLNLAFESSKIPIDAKIKAVMKYMALLPDTRLEAILPRLCDKIVEIHPTDFNSFLLQGDVYSTFLEKQLVNDNEINMFKEKAIQGYTNYIRLDKSKFDVWQNLLNLELQQNAFDSIIVHSQQALAVFPNQTWLYLVSGVANLSANNWKESIFYFEEGVKRSGTNNQMLELFYGYLGDSYHKINEYQKSDENYDKALMINPNNELVLNNYSYYLSLREQKLEKASEMSLKLMRLNSDNLAYLDTYAWVQYKMGNYDEAKRVLKKVVDNKDANAENYDHYGDVLYKLGEIENAKIQWLKAKEMDAGIKNINKKIEQGKIIQ
ncbi:MAG: tetratricopeptide repeat protein [Cyclobacteriaceae bacterium]|nr:tetratricopeptide repeat protein [Cyclobacteriaceae bacterium]